MSNVNAVSDQKVSISQGRQSEGSVQSPLVKKVDVNRGWRLKVMVIAILIVVFGVVSGYGLNLLTGGSFVSYKSSSEVTEDGVREGDVVGTSEETFKDNAKGVLELGGIDGEGSHHLLREGGPDQTAYLTSSVVDLDLFVGHEVEVWGETFSAQKAGWLMDVGRVKVLKLNAPKPFEEE